MRQTARHRRLTALSTALGLGLALGLAGCADYRLDPPSAEALRADAGNVVDPGEIVALVPPGAAAARLREGAVAEGFVLREEVPLGGLGLAMQRYAIPAPLDGAGAIAALERIEPAATAGVNHAYRPAALPAALDYADRLIAWPDSPCRAAGPVGMIDTGIDSARPAFAGTRITMKSFHRGAAAPMRHGTEVAMVLADPGRLSGVTLYGAAVIGHSARGAEEAGVDSLLEALDWMAQNGVRLVNVSLAGPYNKLLDRGIDRAAAHGMTIVAAVGNDGAAAHPRYPAALGNVIAVTAVDAARQIYPMAVNGPFVDIAAPGVDVLLPVEGETRFATGTSIAAPFVTAWLAADPALYGAPPDRQRRALGQSAADLGAPGPDPVFGAGLIGAPASCLPG
ncbi:S8 family serine peptidase [Poseidonocella sp. HB161398]|uniref:S8 family serine peptidase n=1 Tax=Poseidonocella sp. HB161398 TaxID=2320855 RepID=UPI001F1034EA|nr:S8 family serine peptidase [Poseidonocella sp. HB161398]